MTSENLIEMIGSIDENYIIEYSEYPQLRKQTIQKFVKRCVMVASIVLVIGILSLPTIKESQPHNNPAYVKLAIFQTYQEFISTLPKENLLENFTIINGTDYKFVGEYETVNSNIFSKFSISVFDDEKVITTISYELAPIGSAEEISVLHNLAPTTIHDTTVYYKYNEDLECYEAVFMNGTQRYRVEHYTKDESQFFAIIRDILE